MDEKVEFQVILYAKIIKFDFRATLYCTIGHSMKVVWKTEHPVRVCIPCQGQHITINQIFPE